MIVCHCTGISDTDIRKAVAWMRASDAETIITPGKVYRTLGKKADCGGCLSLFIENMRSCPDLRTQPILPLDTSTERKKNEG